MSKINKKNKAGIMLIESLFAVFIVGIVFVSFLTVLTRVYNVEFSKRDYVIATNLAQEGIELVRNIRDNNWKLSFAVDGFSTLPSGSYCVDYLYTSGGCASKLYRNTSTGFYGYNSVNAIISRFSRNIVISGSGDSRTVRSTVAWRSPGTMIDTQIIVDDTLYAWANPE